MTAYAKDQKRQFSNIKMCHAYSFWMYVVISGSLGAHSVYIFGHTVYVFSCKYDENVGYCKHWSYQSITIRRWQQCLKDSQHGREDVFVVFKGLQQKKGFYSTQTYLTLLRLWIDILFYTLTFGLVYLLNVNNRFSIKTGYRYTAHIPILPTLAQERRLWSG